VLGAEPSPAYFNILMYGKESEVLDGTQLAADFTFSGLQKFGQGLEERLRGLKLPRKLLEKVKHLFFLNYTTCFLFTDQYCRDSWYIRSTKASIESFSVQ